MKRPGHTYRIHDFRPFGRGPLVFAFDHSSKGGTYSPRIAVHWGGGRGYIGGWSVRFDVPVLGWARAYRWRRFGALRVYRVMYRIVWRLFR